jgi:glycosyltransferase involved in cell wall biosynthesis
MCPEQLSVCGHRPRAEIVSEIDVLLHLFTEFEPFAAVLLEAALAGQACVATHCGGAHEALVDGETGILFDPADPDKGLAATLRLSADADLRESMGRRARQHYEQHLGIEPMCDAYEKLWRNG